MLYLLLAAAIIVGDQLLKHWVAANIEMGGQVQLLPGVGHLTYLHNTGAAFSSMEGMRWILLGLSVICSVFLIVYLFRTKMGVAAKIAVAFVLGGALGNAIDRCFLGYVIDMFELEFMNFAVFNIADSFIVIGGILYCIVFIITELRAEKLKKAEKAAQVQAAERGAGSEDDRVDKNN